VEVEEGDEVLEGDATMRATLKSTTGIDFKAVVSFVAMCSDDIDHRILAELAFWPAQRFDGLVNLGGELAVAPNDLPGRLYSVPYDAGHGRTCISHVVDVDFLQAWLKHPCFGMVK
jgi:hypothetical protein